MATMTEKRFTGKTAAEPVDKLGMAIYWWVTIGAFFLALQIYIFGSAIMAGDFMHRADPGPTPIPEWMRINFLIQDYAWACALAFTFYIWVVRPLKKTGRLSTGGLFWLGIFFVLWQDPLEDYLDLVFSYNTAPINIGGWACHIPGWVSPGGCGIAEPIFWLPSFYLVCVCTMIVWGLRIASRLKANNPRISGARIFLGLALFVAFFDAVFEMSEIALGYYHYGGLSMAVLPDTRFRFPIWEPFLVAFLYLVWTLPAYFKNDKGETFAEHGLSRVQGSPAKKQWMRLFAFIGIINIGYIVGYNVPIILISMVHHTEWPESVQNKSYFTNGMCGEGTTYACGGDNIGSARRGNSMHVGPNGELVIPPGTKVPKLIPHLRTAE